VSQEIEIINKLGLHARAAARFVQLASRFESELFLQRDSQEVNGKSIMGVMMLAAGCGTQLTLKASGPDEEEAVAALQDLVARRFDEPA